MRFEIVINFNDRKCLGLRCRRACWRCQWGDRI